ncbi:HNH endonuclease [Frankia sp. Cj3]|uniref:HNH endonuclease n=1 Tax=Frankia sp. Cj3 TaxID=2880976 RepID=UPI0035AE42E7
MTLRPCLGLPDQPCTMLARDASRCASCEALRQRQRGTVTQRFGTGWTEMSQRVIAEECGICWLCGSPGADTADHIIRRRDGGTSARDNLRAAHRACNSARG